MDTTPPGGTTRLGSRTVARLGYGAMQLETADDATATRVLRRAVELGVDHIDTASFYGDGTVHAHLRRALHPYPADLALVSKVGAERRDGALVAAQRPEQLRAQVELDLRLLDADRLAVVNLRRMDTRPGILAEGDQVVPIEDQLAELVALREEGKVEAIGLSNVDADQVRSALPAEPVCVQNAFSVLDRSGEAVLELSREHDLTWVPFFPLGSAFDALPSPTDHPVVLQVAAEVAATPAQVALAWLLAHEPRTALITGTRSVEHLEENLAVGEVALPPDAVARLDRIGTVDRAG